MPLAKLEHIKHGAWHAFRGWATARKHLPDVDVAEIGDWKDLATMKRCYQHSDPATKKKVGLYVA